MGRNQRGGEAADGGAPRRRERPAYVTCVVAGATQAGPPEFRAVRVKCTKTQRGRGQHTVSAKLWALDNGLLAPLLAWDETEWLSVQSALLDATDVPDRSLPRVVLPDDPPLNPGG